MVIESFNFFGNWPILHHSAQLSIEAFPGTQLDLRETSSLPHQLPFNENQKPPFTRSTLTGPEIQGSDSGISLHSREDVKSRTNFLNLGIQRASLGLEKTDHGKPSLTQDFSDLPFDMPKLRRRRAHMQQVPQFFPVSCRLIYQNESSILGAMHIRKRNLNGRWRPSLRYAKTSTAVAIVPEPESNSHSLHIRHSSANQHRIQRSIASVFEPFDARFR